VHKSPTLSVAAECLVEITGERLIVLNSYPACEYAQQQTFCRKAHNLKNFEK